jgi:hypothetical protein
MPPLEGPSDMMSFLGHAHSPDIRGHYAKVRCSNEGIESD